MAKAKILNFLQRGKTYLSVALFMDGSDGTDLDALSQKYNIGVTDAERDNKIVVQDNGSIAVMSRRPYVANQLLSDLAAFNGGQFSVHTAAKAIATIEGPYNITLGVNDQMKIAVDGGAPTTFALTANLSHGAVKSTNAQTYDIIAATSDQMLIAVDGGVAVAITLTAGATQSAAAVCADINTAMGITIATVSSDNKVQLTSPTTGTGSIINVEAPVSHSAYTVLGFTVASHAGIGNASRTAAQIVADINTGMGATVAFLGGADSSFFLESSTTGTASEVNVETVTGQAYAVLGLAVANNFGTNGTQIV